VEILPQGNAAGRTKGRVRQAHRQWLGEWSFGATGGAGCSRRSSERSCADTTTRIADTTADRALGGRPLPSDDVHQLAQMYLAGQAASGGAGISIRHQQSEAERVYLKAQRSGQFESFPVHARKGAS
jgi:hypothetical protein